MSRWKWATLIVYIALMAVAILALVRARDRYVFESATRLDSPERVAEWQEWRAQAARQSKDDSPGPVRRREPKSKQPPTVVLLRDYFPMCVAAVFTFGTLLYAVTILLLRGMFTSGGK